MKQVDLPCQVAVVWQEAGYPSYISTHPVMPSVPIANETGRSPMSGSGSMAGGRLSMLYIYSPCHA